MALSSFALFLLLSCRPTSLVSTKEVLGCLFFFKNYYFILHLYFSSLQPNQLFLPAELTAEARRALVQVSKIIQNISNGHEFNEPHMKPLNEFTHAKRDEFHAWLEAAAVRPIMQFPSFLIRSFSSTLQSVPEPALPDKPMEKCTEVEVRRYFPRNKLYSSPAIHRSNKRSQCCTLRCRNAYRW